MLYIEIHRGGQKYWWVDALNDNNIRETYFRSQSEDDCRTFILCKAIENIRNSSRANYRMQGWLECIFTCMSDRRKSNILERLSNSNVRFNRARIDVFEDGILIQISETKNYYGTRYSAFFKCNGMEVGSPRKKPIKSFVIGIDHSIVNGVQPELYDKWVIKGLTKNYRGGQQYA